MKEAGLPERDLDKTDLSVSGCIWKSEWIRESREKGEEKPGSDVI